jgi:vacuolar-type H+-ATPase subunit B/Vma2
MATITQLIMKKRNVNEDDEQLINEIHRLSEALALAYERFELHSDNDLVEATIYEIEALKARYRYLLAIAKEKNLKSSETRLLEYGS